MRTFKFAIVRPPAQNFSQGITTGEHGMPDYQLALAQHQEYCEALEACGLELIHLEPDPLYPDSTFTEDTAVVLPECAVISNPGAASRKGEVVEIHNTLAHYYPKIYQITPPGTLDGGDVCEAEKHYFIGVSRRTNPDGARQLAEILKIHGYTSDLIPIKDRTDLLHLKSGMSYVGDNHLILTHKFQNQEEFRSYHQIPVPEAEKYAANCLRVNDKILFPAFPDGNPHMQGILKNLGYTLISLSMSEFRKMDGGLSCLSLKF